MALIVSLVFTSCFGDVDNEYRVTVSAFATVAENGNGAYRLFLDERRGILEPNEDTNISWGDARRVRIQYDLPYADSIGENTRFKSRVVSAVKVPVLPLVDLTGITELPDTLGTEAVYGFTVSAYRGYMTLETYADYNASAGASLNYSYDRSAFKGDTLFLDLHYKNKAAGSTSTLNLVTCYEIPEFVRNSITSDSLCIAVEGRAWKNTNKLETTTLKRYFKISRRRLTPPTYDNY